MVSIETVALFLLLFALVAWYEAATTYRRYRRVTALLSDTRASEPSDDEPIVRGPISVTEPATLQRDPPEGVPLEQNRPALVAWRIRRAVKRGGRTGTRWQTVDGGIAAGEFSVRQNGRYVRVPGDELSTDDETIDPFEASNLHLGDPTIDVRLGEPDPATKLLERLGLAGDDGLLSDLDVTTSIGGRTLSPDRYQAVSATDGDEIALEGTITETSSGPVVRLDDDPTIVIGENLQRTVTQLRTRALQQLGLGALAILPTVLL